MTVEKEKFRQLVVVPSKCTKMIRFLELARNNGFGTLLAHAPYTLNPCSADPSVARFAAQVLERGSGTHGTSAGNLYNFHPGCHVGQGVEKGIELVAT